MVNIDCDDNMRIEFVKKHNDAKLPKKNHSNDTGYDVFSVEDKLVPAHGSAVVDVGLEFGYIPEGYWIAVESRSGLSFKHNVIAHRGILDNGYRGNAGILLYNLSDKDYQVTKGDRIAQFVLYPIIHADIGWTDQAVESTRGNNGFGSSGK